MCGILQMLRQIHRNVGISIYISYIISYHIMGMTIHERLEQVSLMPSIESIELVDVNSTAFKYRIARRRIYDVPA